MENIDIDDLYREVQNDLNRVVGPLFEFGESQVRKRGAFLPFGATLNVSGEVGMEAASDGEVYSSAIEILPILHEGLRARAKEDQLSAVAVCEWVNVDRDGKRTDAMKVLVEHQRGLTVAFYVPCQKKLMKGWQFQPMFALSAEPEVKPWEINHAS
jgi:hypothetical protein